MRLVVAFTLLTMVAGFSAPAVQSVSGVTTAPDLDANLAADAATAREALVEQLIPVQALLRSMYPQDFGGLWIDQSGMPHVAFVGPAAAARHLVLQAGLVPAAQAHTVLRSEASLRAIMDRLAAQVSQVDDDAFQLFGVGFSSAYADIPANVVRVDVVSGSDSELAAIAQSLGDGVAIQRVAQPARLASCTRSNCGSPMKAGLNLYTSAGVKNCTGAFVMRAGTSSYYVSMAGHCFKTGIYSYYHPVGTYIGTIGNPPTYRSTSGNVDAMLVSISQSQASNIILLRDDVTDTITSKENPANEVIGELVCSSKPSSTMCGHLLSVIGQVGNATEQRIADNQLACGGDSGSPVYYGHKAMGIITGSSGGSYLCPGGDFVGGNSFYTHIRNVEIKFNVQTQLTMP